MAQDNSKVDSNTKADQRYLPRWQVKNRVVYRFDGQPEAYEGKTRDLSCTGACLITPYAVSPDEKLKLSIYLFADKAVEVEGHVVWTKSAINANFIGICFDNLNSETQETILQFAFEIKKNDVVNHWFDGWDGKN